MPAEPADVVDEEVDEGSAEAPAAVAEPRPQGDGRNRATLVLAVATAVFAVLAVTFLALYLSARRDSAGAGDQLSVRTTASRFVEAFVALDTKGSNPADDSTIEQLGTGTIISQHAQAMAALRQLYSASGAVSARGSVKSTYLAQLDDGASEASVIVTVDLVVAGQGPGTPFEHYLDVHLVKLSGAWKVDNVTDINTALASAGSGAASTTTVPASSSVPG